MRMIIKDRGTGKTTQLLYTSETTGFRIITLSENQAKLLKNKADELGLSIPEPMSMDRYMKYKTMLRDKGILIDEVKAVLDVVLDDYFGVHVYAGTMSNNLKEYYKTSL